MGAKVKKRELIKTPWSANSYWEMNVKSISVLCIALMLFGVGDGLLVLASLGSSPWTVLAQGIALKTGLNIGVVTLCISVAVMFTWIPFQQKLGLGTVLNVLLIALGLGLSVELIPPPTELLLRICVALLGIAMIGITSAFYLTCHMGAGPRDGLMVGIYQRTGWRIGVIRMLIEGSVCLLGWLLGGVVGLSTLLFVVGVGWALQMSLLVLNKWKL